MMLSPNRRQALKRFLGGLVSTLGAVVLAQTSVSAAPSAGEKTETTETNIEERANKVAAQEPVAGEEDPEQCAFVNGGFRNGGGGGFRKGGFANGGGGFRKGGFANGGGGFRKGGFANGGGGGFRNGGFRN